MPRIERTTGQQVETQVTQGARAQSYDVTAPQRMIAGALAQVGSDIGEFQERAATTAAEEALVGFERAKNDIFFNKDSGYFKTQGRNAFDGAPDVNEKLLKLQREATDALKTQRAKDMFGKASNRMVTQSQEDIGRHSLKHAQAWEAETAHAVVENTIENASLYYNDPKKLGVQMALGEQQVIDNGKLRGESPEVINENLETYRSSFASATIGAAISQSATEGQEQFDKYGDDLEGGDRVKMKGLIDRQVKLEKTQEDARSSVTTATNLVDQYGGETNARRLIQDDIDKIQDPELRKKTSAEAKRKLDIRQRGDSEERGAIFEDAEGFMFDGGTAESYKMGNAENWEKLSPKQKRSLESGTSVTTDYNFMSEIMLLSDEDLAKVYPADYYHKLSPPDRVKLAKMVGDVRNGKGSNQVGRTRATQTNAQLNQLLGKKSGWNSDDTEKANIYHSALTTEVNRLEDIKGSPLSSAEFTDVQNNLTREIVTERKYWLNSSRDIDDLDPEELRQATDFLTLNNVPITSANILNAYDQANK